MEQVTNSNIQYAVTEDSDIYSDRQLHLMILLPLTMIGLLLFVYILKKFRHDIFDRICRWMILFICRWCLCQNLQNALSLDSLSLSSSSCGINNSTSLKRRLSTTLEDGGLIESSSDNKSSMTSKEILWNSAIGTEADKICQKILFDSDSDSAHKDSKASVISEVSTPPSSIIDTCSIQTSIDSTPSGVILEDKSTQVSIDDLWFSDSEDITITKPTYSSDANKRNYLITRSGKKFYKDI